ncbi:MAG: DegV family protein [Tissierellales bacterium]|nr:DegV family protein [Tissierellales bacterium]
MSKIVIVTDSTSCMTRDYVENNDIKVMPILVDFDGTVIREGFQGEYEESYRLLEICKDFPKTSQPPIGEFEEVFKSAINSGNDVIAIMVSSKTSGTYNTALMAAHMVGSDSISVIDSQTSGPNLRVLVERANELANDGKSRDEIVKIIEKEKKHMSVNMTFETLDYIEKAGRLSHSKKVIVNMLNIKPIVGVVDGTIQIVGRSRGKNKAIKQMIDNIHPDAKIIHIAYILNRDEAQKLGDMVAKKHPDAVIELSEIGPSLGTMFGPRALGILCSW